MFFSDFDPDAGNFSLKRRDSPFKFGQTQKPQIFLGECRECLAPPLSRLQIIPFHALGSLAHALPARPRLAQHCQFAGEGLDLQDSL